MLLLMSLVFTIMAHLFKNRNRNCSENGRIRAVVSVLDLSTRLFEDNMEQTIPGMILIRVGLHSLIGALLNWRLVVGSGKLISRLLGSAGAKNFIVLAGLVLISVGIGMFTGW